MLLDFTVTGTVYSLRRKEAFTMAKNCGCGCTLSQKKPDKSGKKTD